MTNKEFIELIGSTAKKCYATYKVLPSLTIAQAILESGWGKTGLAKDCNNFFGMKWTSTCGTDYKEYKTGEQKADGSPYTIMAKFRKYPNIEAGIKGYYDFLNYTRYQNLKGKTDYREACVIIRTDGWATDVAYTTKLTNIIKTYELWKYDLQVIYPKPPLGNITPDSNFLAIVWLQQNLNVCLAGVKDFTPLVVDGIYGARTRAALFMYWKQLGWNQDNKNTGLAAGVKTKTALATGRKK